MLISCVAYQNGRKLADIAIEDISDYVSRPDCFVWVALFEPTHDEMAQMAEEFGLHELAVEDAQKGHQRPKIEEYSDHLFAVLHTLDRHPDDPADLLVGEVAVFAGRNFVLSVRRGSQQSFAAVRERAEREPEHLALGAGFVLYALMDAVVDRYFPVLEDLEEELDRIERQIFRATPTRASIESFYDLKYRLTVLSHAVGPLMDGVGKLYGGRVPSMAVGAQEYYRDVYDHLQRLSSGVNALREMLQTGIQVSLTLISLSESEATKQLAAWGALIAVPMMIAGIYGMNFEHMPELAWRFGYPWSIALMVGVDAFLYWKFRKAGWI